MTDARTSLAWVSGAVLALIVFRLVAAAIIPLSPDETYYFDWSRFPAWSYFDHPPMVAWWIAAGTAILGDGPLGVRLLATLSAIPTSIALYFTGKELFGRAVAERGVLWINATLLIGVGGMLATPDAASVMFWALALFAFAKIVRSGDGRWWLAVGLFGGLGVTSKLTNLFLGLGILLAVVSFRDLRRWLANPWLWAGGIVAALVVAPMLMWNAGHDWVTLTKQFGRLNAGAFNPLKFPEFIVVQFAELNPLIGIFVGLAAVAWIGRKREYPVAEIGLLIVTALPLVAYLSIHSFHEQIQGHWLAPVFPTLALVAAAAAQSAPGPRWGGLRALAFPVGVGLSLVGLVLAVNPGGVVPWRVDILQVARGWDKFALGVDGLRRFVGAEWIAGTNYSPAAELAYQLRGSGVPIVQVTERVRYAYAPTPDPALTGKPVLVVTKIVDTAYLARCFADIRRVGTIDRMNGNEVIETFIAYLAPKAAPDTLDLGCDRIP